MILETIFKIFLAIYLMALAVGAGCIIWSLIDSLRNTLAERGEKEDD